MRLCYRRQLPNPARQLTAKVVLVLADADGVKAPKNVYLEIDKVHWETLQIVLSGSSKHVSVPLALNTPIASLVQTIHFAAGALITMFVVRLIATASLMATVTT